jgi:hypothetical protein
LSAREIYSLALVAVGITIATLLLTLLLKRRAK